MTIAPNRRDEAHEADRAGSVSRDALDALIASVEGPVLDGGSTGAAAEIAGFQLAVAHRPAVVVCATSAHDVAAAVRWAGEQGLPVAVQSTGHGGAALVDAVVISTSRMTAVSVDPVEGTATLEAGVRWRDVVAVSAPHGLMPMVGSSQGVGAFGYTLGGGLSLVARKHGWAADKVRSLQVVTADGVVRHVDAESEPELFWGMRGSRSNFGIVTSMTVELVPARLWGGPVIFDGAHVREVLAAYRTWTATLPDEAMTSIALLRVPPLETVPEPIRGKFVVHLRYTHCGDPAEAEALLAPMMAAAPVLMAMTGPLDPNATDMVHMDPVDPIPFHDAGALLRDLEPSTIDDLIEVAGPQRDIPVPVVEIRQLGGALAREPESPNAVQGRDASWSLFVIGIMPPELAEVTPHVVQSVLDATRPWQTATVPPNFLGSLGNDDPERLRNAYDPQTLKRLLALKDEVDPHNLFRLGHALR
jgi:hypothetical protein